MTIETKFAPGDEVWMMSGNKPCQRRVKMFTIECGLNSIYQEPYDLSIKYKVTGEDMMQWEIALFPTKAELLASL